MTVFDDQYIEVLEEIIKEGVVKGDRTGTGTVSTFGKMIRIDIRNGLLPLLTTKKMFYNSFIHETLWFISGSTDIEYLKQKGISIWDSWVDPKTARYTSLTDAERRKALIKAGVFEKEEDVPDSEDIQESLMAVHDLPTNKLVGGDIGTGAYGAMWRNIEDTRLIQPNQLEGYVKKGFTLEGFVGERPDGRKAVVTRKIDQLAQTVHLLKTNPDSRRIIVHAFDNRMIDFCVLPPCHSWFQCWTRLLTNDERHQWARDNDIEIESLPISDEAFELQLDQLGVPKRALSLMMIQRSCDYPVGGPFNAAQYSLLTHMLAHVTNMVAESFIWVCGDSHVYSNQLELVKEQLERDPFDNQAVVRFKRKVDSIDDFKFEDIEVIDYKEFHPSIPYPVAV